MSYSKPDLILKKEIIENYKNKWPLGPLHCPVALQRKGPTYGWLTMGKSSLQNHELIRELNKMRKFLLKLSMFYNFINIIILGSFWYIFEKTISVTK